MSIKLKLYGYVTVSVLIVLAFGGAEVAALFAAGEPSWAIWAAALAVVVTIQAALGVAFARSVAGALSRFTEAVSQRAAGVDAELPGAGRSDEIGSLAASVDAFTAQARQAERVKAALEVSSALVMLTNADGRIRYLNAPLSALLTEVEPEIRAAIPSFDAAALADQPLGAFFTDAAERQAVMDALGARQERELALGGRQFTLIMTPITGSDGALLGVVAEWRDRTIELRLQARIDAVVAAAADGDFSQRVALDDVDAARRGMGETLNRVVATVETGVSEAAAAIASLAEGDLDKEMSGEHGGAFADLQQNVNATISRLRTLVTDIKKATNAMGVSTDGILDAATELSARAESQASSIEETAATMEEMTATIKTTAENSTAASTLSTEAFERAGRGAEVVGETVTAMTRIEESSGKISDIISVIDGIAFQTNLLALNAAVEAARAGEAGKGFAVVAQEVRSLAQRSSEAAKDIKDLIQDSGRHVADGVSLVKRSGSALEMISESVIKVTTTINDISDASREQASGVEEISAAISHMDEITQSNAMMSEETASKAGELAADAAQLRRLISFFRIADSDQETVEAEPASDLVVEDDAPTALSEEIDETAQDEAFAAPAPAAKAASGADWAEF